MNATSPASVDSDCFDAHPPSGAFPILVTSSDMQPYLGLVQQVVGRILRRLPCNVDRADLVAAGSYGLMDALRRHPGERDERFVAYARIRIRGAIMDELRAQDWLARSARATANSQVRDGDRSTGTTIVGIDDLPEAQRSIASRESSPFELVARLGQRSALGTAVSSLPDREAKIVSMHYFEDIQFKDIATQMQVSEARVSQLHSRALGMLRPLLASQSECA
jgi:RNA polymerase sigma factor FliA